MQEHKTIQEYLETAAAQIRWKRARSVVMPELRRHLEDQRDAFAAEGHEDAEGLAVEEMGDPVTVGTELDSIHRPRPQWGLLALTMLLALCGALLQIWLTASWSYCYKDADPAYGLCSKIRPEQKICTYRNDTRHSRKNELSK